MARTIAWNETDGIVTLTLDDPDRGANTITDQFRDDLTDVVRRLVDEREGLAGVILTSGKDTFFAGGDLNALVTMTSADAPVMYEQAMQFKSVLRDLETLGIPVVAAMNGAALGGGLEIALACHHRIGVQDGRAEYGLPEVTLGLLPGGGGVVRAVRLLGLDTALDEVLLSGRRFDARGAVDIGLLDEAIDDPVTLDDAAREWIGQNPDPVQPWDREGARGGVEPTGIPIRVARFSASTRGAPAAAAHSVLCAAVEGAQLDLESALRIETRHFIALAIGTQAKGLVYARFLDPLAARRGASRPTDEPRWEARRAAVLGAGMMGMGIAHACATSGIEVVLTDVDHEQAAAGKEKIQALLDRDVSRGRIDPAERGRILQRVVPTGNVNDAKGVDLVIEAVFEDERLKQGLLREISAIADEDALIGSNTSTIPITSLSSVLPEPERGIGLHFFSPVHRMPLIEIICGARTSSRTLARAFDVARQLRKTPIVVNDNRGFFTSRVIGTVINEGVAMLLEGIPPASIERAAITAGYPVGMLQLADELNLELGVRAFREAAGAAKAEGRLHDPHPAEAIFHAMVAGGRPGRQSGAGFYDYEDGRRTGLWAGLTDRFANVVQHRPLAELRDRLLFVEVIDSVRCLDEGVLTSALDGNVGSVLGIGFPAWTGGVFRFVDHYPGGSAGFVTRADELRERYGARYDVPPLLRALARRGEPIGDFVRDVGRAAT